MNTRCKHCGKVLPPQHAGRGKQKTFCSDTCRVKFAYREQHPKRVTNAERRGHAAKLKLPLAERARLGGLFDGEGYIGLTRRKKRAGLRWYYFPNVWMFNTNKALIDSVVAALGKAAHYTVFHRTNGKGHRPIYTVKVNRASMGDLLAAISPYLVAKRRQAEIVAEFCRISDGCYVRAYPEARYEAMWHEIKALNRKGVPNAR